jgi:hypothetical protein
VASVFRRNLKVRDAEVEPRRNLDAPVSDAHEVTASHSCCLLGAPLGAPGEPVHRVGGHGPYPVLEPDGEGGPAAARLTSTSTSRFADQWQLLDTECLSAALGWMALTGLDELREVIGSMVRMFSPPPHVAIGKGQVFLAGRHT